MCFDYYKSIIEIPNELWIGIRECKFDFGYKDKVIINDCSNFSYISGKIIALKKEDTIIVYSTNILYKDSIKTVEKLLEFKTYSNVAYGKIICERNIYLIDGNCQIRYSERSHIS